MGSRFLALNAKQFQSMKPIQTTLSASRLTNEAATLQNLIRWFYSPSSFCSSLMGEQVTHLQVLSALCMFLFLTLAVFSAPRDIFITLLFIALAAFCRRGMEKKGGIS